MTLSKSNVAPIVSACVCVVIINKCMPIIIKCFGSSQKDYSYVYIVIEILCGTNLHGMYVV